MKDFREPFNNKENDNSSIPNHRTFEHGGNASPNISSLLGTLLFIGFISISVYFYFSNNAKDNSNADSGNESAFINIDKIINWVSDRQNDIQTIISENEDSKISDENSEAEIVEGTSSLEPESNKNSSDVTTEDAKLIEYYIGKKDKDYELYGIVQNTSNNVFGKIRMNVTVSNNNSLNFSGETMAGFLTPGNKTPIKISLKGWNGDGDLNFVLDGEAYFKTDIAPVDVSFSKGKWSKGSYRIIYKANFENKNLKEINFPQIILVLRNSKGEIYSIDQKFLGNSNQNYIVKAKESFPIEVEVFFQDLIPTKTDVYFSFLPL
jgi:hypothetical protein